MSSDARFAIKDRDDLKHQLKRCESDNQRLLEIIKELELKVEALTIERDNYFYSAIDL